MFKKKFNHVHERISRQEMRWRDTELKILAMNKTLDGMDEQYRTMRTIKADMAKMDLLTSMMSELARRIDMAGVPTLPDECKCESCGCTTPDNHVVIQRLDSIEDLDAYCVKCKDKRRMIDFVIKTSDSGRRMAQGKCPVCNTKVNRILGKVKV